MEQHFMPKNAVFYCDLCDFKCCKKSNWDNHVNTKKHNLGVSGNQMENAGNAGNAENVCECGKKYRSKSGLWKHKSKCNETTVITTVEIIKEDEKWDKDQLILMLIKQNSELIKETSEFKNMMMEQQNMMMKVLENGTHNTTHTNSHNKAFNLQFFLNETCKDAMNIMDFVESIQLQLSDLEKVGEIGYVEGISNIIVKNLKALDVTQRPVHCTDKKRETMYVKDADKWEKDEHTTILSKVIKKVASKNVRLLPKFKEKYPDYGNYHSKNSDKYSKIIVESMGGSGDNDAEKEEKIIRNIAKNVVVEKDQ